MGRRILGVCCICGGSEPHWNSGWEYDDFCPQHSHLLKSTIMTKKEYARDVAIGFGNWIQSSLYVHDGKIKVKPEIAKQFGGTINTTTLFDLYEKLADRQVEVQDGEA